MQQISCAIELGPRRFELLGSFGHPEIIDGILQAIANPNPLNALAAGLAFARITGVDIESDQRAIQPVEVGSQPDEFEQEIPEEAYLPDPHRANSHWNEVKTAYSHGTRWSGGHDLSHGVSDEVMSELDMLTRWEMKLRIRYERNCQGAQRIWIAWKIYDTRTMKAKKFGDRKK